MKDQILSEKSQLLRCQQKVNFLKQTEALSSTDSTSQHKEQKLGAFSYSTASTLHKDSSLQFPLWKSYVNFRCAFGNFQ